MESYLVTQLFTACTRGDLESVKRLLEQGVSPLIRDNQGNTLFHLCCSSVQCGLEVLQYLITVSNSVNYNYLVNNDQQTLLHLACCSDKLDFVEYLFNHHFGSFTSFDIHADTLLSIMPVVVDITALSHLYVIMLQCYLLILSISVLRYQPGK